MADNNVSRLQQELQATNPERYELVQAVRQAIYSVVPDASERVMYGGVMFSGDIIVVTGFKRDYFELKHAC